MVITWSVLFKPAKVPLNLQLKERNIKNDFSCRVYIYLVGDLLKFKKTKEVFVPFIFSPTFSSTFCESCWFMWNIRERFEIL